MVEAVLALRFCIVIAVCDVALPTEEPESRRYFTVTAAGAYFILWQFPAAFTDTFGPRCVFW